MAGNEDLNGAGPGWGETKWSSRNINDRIKGTLMVEGREEAEEEPRMTPRVLA